MAKKRKASAPARSGPKELDPADARLGPITTYEDVADSEDEYFANRDKIMFDDGPKSKRRKRDEEEEAFLEHSDEEVLDLDDGDSEEEDTRKASRKSKKAKAAPESDEEAREEDDEMNEAWGKGEYYNADQPETEDQARGEEIEAMRLQKKKLSKMSDKDFGLDEFDEEEWQTSKPDEEEEHETVTEVLKDIEITDDMGPEERRKMLQSKYPEFEHLVNEFQELQPQLVTLKKEANGKSGQSLEAVKYWVLGCYVAALASYFAILTSPSRDDSSTQKTLSPAEIRDHEVMETLLECREAWQQVKTIMPVQPVGSIQVSEEEPIADEAEDDEAAFAAAREEARRLKKLEKASKAKKKQAQAVEDSLADLDDLIKESKKSKKAKKAIKKASEDDNSDFGEEEALDARTAADKAARKKSLRFYTSQIVQKAMKRTDAGRDAGGDHDIPYRERLRDRQARLNAEAERRGQKGSKYGAELGDDASDEEDAKTAAALRDNGDEEYYDMVAAKSKKKKDEKQAYKEALAAASKTDRIVEQEVIGEDGKRKITYAIEKNKGLTPKRKKEVRNPRVKKRMMYEAKQKKLRSMMPVWKGGEPKGGYAGELSGITTGIVRARKL